MRRRRLPSRPRRRTGSSARCCARATSSVGPSTTLRATSRCGCGRPWKAESQCGMEEVARACLSVLRTCLSANLSLKRPRRRSLQAALEGNLFDAEHKCMQVAPTHPSLFEVRGFRALHKWRALYVKRGLGRAGVARRHPRRQDLARPRGDRTRPGAAGARSSPRGGPSCSCASAARRSRRMPRADGSRVARPGGGGRSAGVA
jgi:hypothetical protein